MQYKVGIVKFLGSGTFEPEHVACHLLVASGNSFRRYNTHSSYFSNLNFHSAVLVVVDCLCCLAG